MKIAHVITRLIIGGAQENTILTCEGLRARGHDVTLIAGPETGPEGSLWPRAERDSGRLIRVATLRRSIHPLIDVRCARQLTGLFKKEQFDVVHTHSSKAGIIGRHAARRAGIRHIVHTIHGMSFNRTQPRWMQRGYALLERRAARHTDAIICVADAMIAQSVAAGIAPGEKFVTIRSGMETGRYGPSTELRRAVRAEWGIPESAVVVGTVARLFRNKGYEDLLAALPAIARTNPSVRFVWVGDGPQCPAYVAALERLGLRDRVHLTGLVSPSAIPRILTGFDLLVHASRWEGLPRALVQAALTEVPAVSFDNDGAPEVVTPEVTGLLAPLGDADALARQVISLADDAARRQRMGFAARRQCLTAFDHHKMVAEIESVYQRLAAAPA